MAPRRRNDVLIPTLGVVFDAAAILAAFVGAYALRFNTRVLEFLPLSEDVPELGAYLASALIVIPAWILLFNARDMYGARRNVALSDELVRVARLVTMGMLFVMSAAFFYRAFSYSRVVFVLLWGSSIPLIFLGRIVVRSVEASLYRIGRDLRKAVIVGNGDLAISVFSTLHRHPLLGYTVSGYYADTPADDRSPLAGSRYLGGLDAVPETLVAGDIELVVIAVGHEQHRQLQKLIRDCEGINVEFMMVPDILELMASRMRVEEIEGMPFIRLKGVRITAWGRILKRLFDIVVSLILLLILSPVFLLVALGIRIDSRGPVFFSQERVGLDGRKFRMLKFRSMREGAEKKDHEAGLGLRDDPRVTRMGSLLRATSIDEFPQLINVFLGEMSLVGPRPERTLYVERFKHLVPKYLDRHRVKTGMTGWAQVNGFRGDSSLEGRIQYDMYYIENWSFGFDLRILLRTIGAVILPKSR
jgi:Undecaprenyl-phosphate glucose phosphotransferase